MTIQKNTFKINLNESIKHYCAQYNEITTNMKQSKNNKTNKQTNNTKNKMQCFQIYHFIDRKIMHMISLNIK